VTTWIFLFEYYGSAISKAPMPGYNPCIDIHLWDLARDSAKFDKHFVICLDSAPNSCATIVDIMGSHWDCFYSKGAHRPPASKHLKVLLHNLVESAYAVVHGVLPLF
jgi:hypothetical protein